MTRAFVTDSALFHLGMVALLENAKMPLLVGPDDLCNVGMCVQLYIRPRSLVGTSRASALKTPKTQVRTPSVTNWASADIGRGLFSGVTAPLTNGYPSVAPSNAMAR